MIKKCICFVLIFVYYSLLSSDLQIICTKQTNFSSPVCRMILLPQTRITSHIHPSSINVRHQGRGQNWRGRARDSLFVIDHLIGGVTESEEMHLWDYSGSCKLTVQDPEHNTYFCVTADNRNIYAGLRFVRNYEALHVLSKEGKVRNTVHCHLYLIFCSAFYKNKLLVGGLDSKDRLYEIDPTTDQVCTTYHNKMNQGFRMMSALHVLQQRNIVVSALGRYNSSVTCWDPISGEAIGSFAAQENGIETVSGVNEYTVASGDSKGIVKLWDIRNYQQIYQWQAHTHAISALALKGAKLYSASLDGTIKSWKAI